MYCLLACWLFFSMDAKINVVVVGDTTVGKTCLILRYSEDVFRENLLSTLGIDYKVKYVSVDKKRIKLQLWDTAGQERFHSLVQGFYRGAKGIIIVYDISKELSFQNVSRWLDNISANTNEAVCPVLGVIGNKSDLNEKRQVTRTAGEQLAKRVGATFGEVSAKTGDGIDEVFGEFVRKLKDDIDNHEDIIDQNNIEDTVDVTNNSKTNRQRHCCTHGKTS